MKELLNKIIQNTGNLQLISNANILIILVYLYSSKAPVTTGDMEKYCGLGSVEIINYLSILQKKGLVDKIDRIDKSRKPAFIVSRYKINEKSYEKMLSEIKEMICGCLNSSI